MDQILDAVCECLRESDPNKMLGYGVIGAALTGCVYVAATAAKITYRTGRWVVCSIAASRECKAAAIAQAKWEAEERKRLEEIERTTPSELGEAILTELDRPTARPDFGPGSVLIPGRLRVSFSPSVCVSTSPDGGREWYNVTDSLKEYEREEILDTARSMTEAHFESERIARVALAAEALKAGQRQGKRI